MTQQVLHARVLVPSTQPLTDPMGFGVTVEATGANTNVAIDGSDGALNSIIAFMNAANTTHPLAYYTAGALDHTTNAGTIEWTDVTAHLDGLPAGGPFRIDNFTLGATAGAGDLPPACAVVVGMRADYGTDIEHGAGTRPRARDRGRIYFGPLVQAVTGGTYSGQLAGTARTDFGVAIARLLATHNSGLDTQWNVVIWSRKAAAVKTARWWYIQEAVGYIRRRADESSTRVHSWNGPV